MTCLKFTSYFGLKGGQILPMKIGYFRGFIEISRRFKILDVILQKRMQLQLGLVIYIQSLSAIG